MRHILNKLAIDELIEKTLFEDVQNGDVTTRNIFSGDQTGKANIIARENLILCGLEICQAVFNKLTNKALFTSCSHQDGDEIKEGNTILKIECGLIPLLEGERCALNILQWLSGIATLTNKFVKKASPVKVLDTRKTTPGLRIFEKYFALNMRSSYKPMLAPGRNISSFIFKEFDQKIPVRFFSSESNSYLRSFTLYSTAL